MDGVRSRSFQTANPRLQLFDLSFGFSGKKLFHRLSLSLGAENPVAVLGPSGCGKTTLLRLMAGLLDPWSGQAVYEPGDEAGKTGIGFVFQEPRLLPWLTVWENVSLPIKKRFSPKAVQERTERFLELVSLKDKMRVYPEALSGGQRQRVSIARAFAYPAGVLFMDEPFQSLDIPLRIELMEMILTLLEEAPRLLIAVTHDPREAIFFSRRIVVLGKPPEGIVFDQPVSSKKEYASPESHPLESALLKAIGGLRPPVRTG
jgi:NitT/TauT family transport system ATP-binding protein